VTLRAGKGHPNHTIEVSPFPCTLAALELGEYSLELHYTLARMEKRPMQILQ